jgi:AdoMet-dependent heme synthase
VPPPTTVSAVSPGVFDATLDTAHMIGDLGLRLQINTTVTRRTITELPDVLRLVMAMDAFLWSVFFLVPTGRGEHLDALDADETEDVLHWLHDVSRLVAIKTTEAPHFRRVALQRAGAGRRNRLGPLDERFRAASADLLAPDRTPERRVPRPPLNVNAGNGFVFVDHLGAVYPSGFLPIPVGSVRDRPITEIYRDSPLLRQLREPAGFGGRCGHCEFREVCGGSRSRAYATTGDPLAEEPTCNHQPARRTPAGGVAGQERRQDRRGHDREEPRAPWNRQSGTLHDRMPIEQCGEPGGNTGPDQHVINSCDYRAVQTTRALRVVHARRSAPYPC